MCHDYGDRIFGSVTLDGASAGLKFYLIPDFEAVKKQGVMTVVSAAMGQAFFTLSLGIGAIRIYDRWITVDRRFTSDGTWTYGCSFLL